VLTEAGITAQEVEKVFLTGGTSFVPRCSACSPSGSATNG